ncbi:MAG: helix-turn-helix domain-containing protein [Candidatus Limimorpha sp.]
MPEPYILYYSVNLILLVTHIYGGFLKLFYKPRHYKDDFGKYYPGNSLMASFYLVQIVELPYLLNIQSPAALLYVNGITSMIFPLFLSYLVKVYFFSFEFDFKQFFIKGIPALLMLVMMLPFAFGISELTDTIRDIFVILTTLFTFLYCVDLLISTNTIKKISNERDDMWFSNESDFVSMALPDRNVSFFTKVMVWIPVLCSLIGYVVFIADNQLLKMFRDLAWIIINSIVCLCVLEPYRRIVEFNKMSETSTDDVKEVKVESNKYSDLMAKMVARLKEEKLFTNTNLCLEDLASMMGTNRRYVSEAIRESKWGSFYNMINDFRVEYVIELMKRNPNAKLETLAMESGFSSASMLSRTFKRLKNQTPREYLKSIG